MFIAEEAPPVGGAALDQVIGLSVAAALVTGVLLFIAWQHRTGRIDWIDNVGKRFGATTGEPGWSAISTVIVASSLIVALLGFMWDVSLHAGRGRDEGPLANPAHYLILYGLFALFVAGMAAIIYPRNGDKAGVASVRITRHWYAPVSGIFIAACGLYALIGFPLDDVWHRLFGQDVTLWGPTHLMLIGGAGLSTAGIILLHREAEFAMKREGRSMPGAMRWMMLTFAFGGLLIGLSVFQAEFDFGIAQFRMVFAPLMIVAAAALTLIAARLYVGPGAALGAAVFFVLMRGVVSFIVTDVFGQAHHVFPLYIGSAILIELLAFTALKNKPLVFGAVGGFIIASVGLVIELVWNDLVFSFPWPQDVWLESLAMAIPVGIGAGLCSALFYLGLTAQSPARNVGRAIVVGSVLVLSAAVWNGLNASVPEDATATVNLTQVGTEDAPEVIASVSTSPGLVDENPAWVQITAWQGGGEGIVLDQLKRTGPDSWESTKPVPIGGTWKTILRVQDGRMLTALPIFLPEDPALELGEVSAEPSFTRDFGPEIDLLQRERKEGDGIVWALANLVVLLFSLGIILGICLTVSRVSRTIAEAEAGEGASQASSLNT